MSARPSVVALRRAGPLAFAGVAANAANVIVTVTIAHLLSSRDYGSLGQLLVLFLVLSMPGSALLVAVVRRVTAWSMAGQAYRIKPWASSVRRWGLLGLALLAVVAWLSRSWLATGLAAWPRRGGRVPDRRGGVGDSSPSNEGSSRPTATTPAWPGTCASRPESGPR